MCLKLEHKRRHFETNKVSWPHEQNHHEKTISLDNLFSSDSWLIEQINSMRWREKNRYLEPRKVVGQVAGQG